MNYTMNMNEASTMLKAENLTIIEKVTAEFVLATFGKDAEAVKAYAEAQNKKAMAEAVTSLFEGNTFKWADFVEGVAYPFIDTEAEEDAKAVKMKEVFVRDIFCKKVVKDSKKVKIDDVLFAMATTFGHNMGAEFVADKFGKEAVCKLKMYTKYTDAPKVFFENATSNKGHERQLQVFFDTFFGEGVAVAKKIYVDHLKSKFITATKDGYADKNEFALLQLICYEARRAKHNEGYTYMSRLDCHKEPKVKGEGKKK